MLRVKLFLVYRYGARIWQEPLGHAISIRQPAATALCKGVKRVENRTTIIFQVDNADTLRAKEAARRATTAAAKGSLSVAPQAAAASAAPPPAATTVANGDSMSVAAWVRQWSADGTLGWIVTGAGDVVSFPSISAGDVQPVIAVMPGSSVAKVRQMTVPLCPLELKLNQAWATGWYVYFPEDRRAEYGDKKQARSADDLQVWVCSLSSLFLSIPSELCIVRFCHCVQTLWLQNAINGTDRVWHTSFPNKAWVMVRVFFISFIDLSALDLVNYTLLIVWSR